MTKYAIDTNVYIDAFGNPEQAEALAAFLQRHVTETWLSAVVVQELRVGARTPETSAELQANIFAPLERRGRVFAPSASAFKECGRVLVELITRDGLVYADTKRSPVNDVLLSVSCREHGVTLITNDQDFVTIGRYVKGLATKSPWP